MTNEIIIELEETLDHRNVLEFVNTYKKLNYTDCIVIDCAKCERIDSAGLGALLLMKKSLGYKVKIKIINICPFLERIFKITNFGKLFDLVLEKNCETCPLASKCDKTT
jgi:anti-anti-sigma factor